jgi:hypothetical protein
VVFVSVPGETVGHVAKLSRLESAGLDLFEGGLISLSDGCIHDYLELKRRVPWNGLSELLWARCVFAFRVDLLG